MSELSIRIERLSKIYRIGERERYRTLRDAIANLVRTPGKRLVSGVRQLSSDGGQTPNDRYIWALKDVSFQVRQGEVLGIIGPNGAGKTTLLKILSRITEPTEGYAEIHGRMGSLLEVGTGFHPELAGRENIYLNGAILGMKRSEIDRKFDEIVAFSGVEKFIDTPLKRYSSGMYVRLAFAVAAHLDPEILVVDEVLAVGDANFQEKAIDNDSLTVVDFWAEWCGPCRMVGPIIEELASEYDGKALIGKVNVDHNQEISMKYGVRSIPTILFLKNGEVVDKQVGATSKQVLASKIEAHI